MALNVTFTLECHCGEDAKMTTTYLGLNPGDPVVIDVELSAGQSEFSCAACGCVLGTGDLYHEVVDPGDGCESFETGQL